MSQTNCLNSVIREVNNPTPELATSERLVMFDVEGQHVVTSEWYRPVGPVKYFVVSTTAMANCVVAVIHVLDHGDQGKAVGLRIGLVARCPEGNQERVVEALGADETPTAALITQIRTWSRDYLGRQTATFFDSFMSSKLLLASYLAGRALTDIGLDLVVEVSLYGDEGATGTTSLGPWDLQVETRDYRGFLHVRLFAELVPDNLVDAVAYRGERESLPDLVRQATHRYFLESVSVAQLFREPDNVAIDLKAYLNERVKMFGQRVQNLRLESNESVPQQDSEVLQHVEYKGVGYPEPIFITEGVKVSVREYGAYVSSGKPDLTQWLTQTLNEVTQETFSDKTYPSLLLELTSIARDIKNKISFKAAAIGCSVQQQLVITSPTLEQWSKEFETSTEETFATLFERFQIKLRIVVVAALKQPEAVVPYLVRGTDLSELIGKKINDELRRLLLTVHPMRLCDRIISNGSIDQEPVKLVLDRAVREKLMREFNIEPISVSIEILESGFTKSLNSFWNESITFDAELSWQDPRYRGPAVYSFDCQIETITTEGWETAAAAGFDFVKLRTQLVNALKGELENYDHPGENAARIKDELTTLVKDYALSEFGLALHIRSIRRKPSDAERKLREAATANEIARIELIRKLEHDVLQLIANGTKPDDIAAWRTRIAELKAYNTSGAAEPKIHVLPKNDVTNGNSGGVPAVENLEVAK